MSSYRLKILTPESKVYDSEVTGTTVTCEDGQLTVLAGHAPMVAALVEGEVTVQTGKEIRKGETGPGFLQADRDGTVIMVRFFRWDGDEMPEGEDDGSAETDNIMF